VAEGQDLRFEFGASSEAGPNQRKESRDARAHDEVNVISEADSPQCAFGQASSQHDLEFATHSRTVIYK
jgi:hypothetical protein